ncbi:hypothetical protein E2C06_29185 [Dankookia rubra]|uniref:Tyr recombinase domain-containing protein n=1 Tax=Dankookia rubra TaxID=1442381 RepID=A0A4R5Q838_9PROT|nr:hypothetical protein E2C06_29185 [Dankookia rubra]
MYHWVTRRDTVEPRRLGAGGVLLIRRRRAGLAGLQGIEGITPHSLRTGFVTHAYQAGLRDKQIMQHTRHRDLASMRRYVRRARLLQDSAAQQLCRIARLCCLGGHARGSHLSLQVVARHGPAPRHDPLSRADRGHRCGACIANFWAPPKGPSGRGGTSGPGLPTEPRLCAKYPYNWATASTSHPRD